MPWASDAQRKWAHATKQPFAATWDAHTPKGAKLPEHVKQTRQPKGQGGGGRYAGYTASPLVRQTRRT